MPLHRFTVICRNEKFAVPQRTGCCDVNLSLPRRAIQLGIELAKSTKAGGNDNGTRHDGTIGTDDLGNGCVDGGLERVAACVAPLKFNFLRFEHRERNLQCSAYLH